MEIRITPDALVEFEQLPLVVKARIRDVWSRLEKWPDTSGAKPLRHGLKGHHRIRTGDYRVIFKISGEIVTIVKIAHRRDVYED